MSTYDLNYPSISAYGGRIRKTVAGRFVAERSDGGRIKRKTFDTEDGAKKYLRELGVRRDKQGIIATALTSPQIRDALDALHRIELSGLEVTLCEVVAEYVTRHARDAVAPTLRNVYDQYLLALRNPENPQDAASPLTIEDKEKRVKLFLGQHGHRPVTAIEKSDVDAWEATIGTSGRNLRNYRTQMQSVFNFAETVVPGFTNTVARWSFKKPKLVQPAETVTPAVASRLLIQLELANPRAALSLALGCFAGLRTAEATQLRWKDIDLETGELTVPAIFTKTRRARTVPLTSNLLTWLLRYKSEEGRVGLSERKFQEARSKACKELGIEWPSNAARHSYATALCKLEGIHVTAERLGHTGNVAVLLDHYKGENIPESVANAWFSILPTDADTTGKIIRIGEA